MTAEKITAIQLAKQLNVPISELLVKFKEANMRVKEEDQPISSAQQKKIKEFLNISDEAVPVDAKPVVEETKASAPKMTLSLSSKKIGLTAKQETTPVDEDEAPKKITLRRKMSSKLKISGTHGDKKTVNVKVIKKRTYVKKAPVIEEPVVEEVAEEVTEEVVVAAEQIDAAVDKKTTATTSAPVAPVVTPQKTAAELAAEEEEKEKQKKKKKAARGQQGDAKQKHRLAIRNIRMDGEEERAARRFAQQRVLRTSHRQEFHKPTQPIVHTVDVPETISVTDLAQRMTIKVSAIIRSLMKMGVMATINQSIDQDTAILVVEEMGHKPNPVKAMAVEDTIHEGIVAEGEAVDRAPVVTIMGHVDHGKTTLLDFIRRTKVADGEAGGITQNIGAYHVETDKGVVTFLDTPGHEAFTAMRSRGAKVTDLVILVVAADDGVMPQTIEAIAHAKAAGVPIVVAVNKIDKPEADPEKIKSELANHEVIPEDWGGDVMFMPISAKHGDGVDALLDAVLLQAEVLELKARELGAAEGIVVEARLDKGRGVVATVLVQKGTLKQGDIVVCGTQFGRLRAMLDENMNPIKTAGPSIPVEILGLSGAPQAGDEMTVVVNERKAREVTSYRDQQQKNAKLADSQASKLDDLFSRMKEDGKTQNLNILLKADVQGSLEAINDSLLKLSNDEVKVKIVAKGVGGITGSDASLALASKAIIFGFNVRADNMAREIIQREGLDVHYHSIIYNVIDEVKRAANGMLAPEFKQKIIGLAEVRDVFRSSKIGAIAGCMVIDGEIKRNKPIRILRDNVVIFEGELESLRRHKDDVNEVKKGVECGIGVKEYNDIKPGDQIEVFETVKVERKID